MQRSSVAALLREHGRVVDGKPKPLVSLSAGFRCHKSILAERERREIVEAQLERMRVDRDFRQRIRRTHDSNPGRSMVSLLVAEHRRAEREPARSS